MSFKPNWSLLTPAGSWYQSVNGKTLRGDLIAGLTNATIVLPQGVAFATIAGLPPIYGLYTAMITPIVAALFGSSMVMVSGPTTAISAVVFSTVAGIVDVGTAAFVNLAILLAFLVGVIQFVLGFAGLGRLVAFVSHSVMLGFTAAAAVLIGASQIAPALGISVENGGSVIERVWRALAEGDEANWRAFVVAMTALAVAALMRRLLPRSPTFMLGLIAAGLVGIGLDAESHGVRTVGHLPSVVPTFHLPIADVKDFGVVMEGAFAIALIGLLEAVSIGRAFAYRTGMRFDANQEIVGQGLSNMVGSFFQSYPGSGSFTRSGINFEAGAKTPMSAIFASVFLFVILLALGPYVGLIPIPGLAGIILLVAWNLINFQELWRIFRTDLTETVIVAATFVAGTMVELDFAIFVGVILSLMMFISRSARPNLVVSAPDEYGVFRDPNVYALRECPQVVFIRIDGPLYFGSVESVERGFRRIERARPSQKHLILMLEGVGDLDLAGAHALIDEARRRKARGGGLYIVTRSQLLSNRLRRFHVIEEIGEDALFASKSEAIESVVETFSDEICATCDARIFRECKSKLNTMALQ